MAAESTGACPSRPALLSPEFAQLVVFADNSGCQKRLGAARQTSNMVSSMKIPVDRLTGSPARFRFQGGASWWQAGFSPHEQLPGELVGPVELSCEAHLMGEHVFLAGGIEGAMELECGRCLARYRHRLSEDFRLALEPAGNRVPADPEGAEALARDGICLGDELETGWFQGHEINLEAVFLELVSLAIPVKPLCREDCAGLCPQCGASLEGAGCSCPKTNLNSPFAVLAGIRNGLTEGGD
jgi:uncharacterized protein